jgi:hypothetical protein
VEDMCENSAGAARYHSYGETNGKNHPQFPPRMVLSSSPCCHGEGLSYLAIVGPQESGILSRNVSGCQSPIVE